MIDIKVISIRDVLAVSKVDIAQGYQPLSLDIQGPNLLDASEVLINDISAPEYIILNISHLIAQVPASLYNSPIQKVQVLAEAPSTTRSSLLSFTVGPTFKALKGIERMVQLFCKILLQTPGSDRFNPALGGGLLNMAGQTIQQGGGSSLSATIIHAVSRTRDQILTLQSANANTPADERLLTADTTSVGFDASTTTATATIHLVALSGQQAVANLTW